MSNTSPWDLIAKFMLKVAESQGSKPGGFEEATRATLAFAENARVQGQPLTKHLTHVASYGANATINLPANAPAPPIVNVPIDPKLPPGCMAHSWSSLDSISSIFFSTSFLLALYGCLQFFESVSFSCFEKLYSYNDLQLVDLEVSLWLKMNNFK